jgi:thiol:disulfide interchange protein
VIYVLAYIGGILLNLMPCVLHVLFFKAMSMQRRSWQYVAGVLSMFFTFGIAATAPGFIWGGQSNHSWFTWGTAAVCFALGLTYLDVWALPNFGFREAQSDLGKGVLTTMLSSACSEPFLGAVFAASLTEPRWKVITLFMLIGLGLVTPYLFFPRSWIPRPGAWMVWVKKLAGTEYSNRLLAN